MYKIMFYTGIAGFVISIAVSVYIFKKKKIAQSIRNLLLLLMLFVSCINLAVAGFREEGTTAAGAMATAQVMATARVIKAAKVMASAKVSGESDSGEIKSGQDSKIKMELCVFDSFGKVLPDNNGVIYCNSNIVISVCVSKPQSGDDEEETDEESAGQETTDKNNNGEGSTDEDERSGDEEGDNRAPYKVYARIKGSDIIHAAREVENDSCFCVDAFTEDWTEIENGYFDGVLEICVEDESGTVAEVETKPILYNTDKPVINVKTDGVVGRWTNKKVKFNVNVAAENAGIGTIVCYVDGRKVKEFDVKQGDRTGEYEYVMEKSSRNMSGNSVEFKAMDMCGNAAGKSFKVLIDREKPQLSLKGIAAGEHYADDVYLETAVSDLTYPATKVTYDISRLYQGTRFEERPKTFIPSEEKDRSFVKLTHEGEYTIAVKAKDGAGNVTETKKVSFVIDRTAPQLNINGIDDDSVHGKNVRLQLSCYEDNYATEQIMINVERSHNDKNESYSLTPFMNNMPEECVVQEFSDEGEYDVTFDAVDKAGNKAQEKQIHFCIDKTAPKIRVTGTKAYEQFDRHVDISIGIEEYNYKDIKVEISGKRTDSGGKVFELKSDGLKASGIYSVKKISFDKDGIYELMIRAGDKAGNTADKKIHFLIDTKSPAINGIEELDGGYFKNVCLADKLIGMFDDLTLSSYRIIVNGEEYNGTEDMKEEGKYSIHVEAVDELGHKSSKNASFIIDNTSPRLLFFGASDGETVCEAGVVSWKLSDENDKITKIKINGKEVSADLSELRYNESGKYKIEIESVDYAGNEGHSQMQFEYVEKDVSGLFGKNESKEGNSDADGHGLKDRQTSKALSGGAGLDASGGGDVKETLAVGHTGNERLNKKHIGVAGLLVVLIVSGVAAFIITLRLRCFKR